MGWEGLVARALCRTTSSPSPSPSPSPYPNPYPYPYPCCASAACRALLNLGGRGRRGTRTGCYKKTVGEGRPHGMLQKNAGGRRDGTYRDIVRVTCKLIDAPKLV